MIERALTIAGMHRSGTSVLSQMLHEMGIRMGDSLLGARPSNPQGHFEDLDFLNLHQGLLQEMGREKTGLLKSTKVNPDEHNLRLINELLQKKVEQYGYAAWKEPRTALFLDQYDKLVTDLHLIIVIRPMEQVVDSLLQRATRQQQTRKVPLDAPVKTYIKRVYARLRSSRNRKELTRLFAQAWINYNTYILEYARRNPEHTMVLRTEEIPDRAEHIVRVLQAWGYPAKELDLQKIYREGLLKKRTLSAGMLPPETIREAARLYADITALAS